eukprot:g2847.t1
MWLGATGVPRKLPAGAVEGGAYPSLATAVNAATLAIRGSELRGLEVLGVDWVHDDATAGDDEEQHAGGGGGGSSGDGASSVPRHGPVVKIVALTDTGLSFVRLSVSKPYFGGAPTAAAAAAAAAAVGGGAEADTGNAGAVSPGGAHTSMSVRLPTPTREGGGETIWHSSSSRGGGGGDDSGARVRGGMRPLITSADDESTLYARFRLPEAKDPPTAASAAAADAAAIAALAEQEREDAGPAATDAAVAGGDAGSGDGGDMGAGTTRRGVSVVSDRPPSHAETLGLHRRAAEAKIKVLAGRVGEMESQLAQIRCSFKLFTDEVNQQMALILGAVREMKRSQQGAAQQ